MERIIVSGGAPLYGTIDIDGMKNAALPVIFATVLVGGKCEIHNLPLVSDIEGALEIISELGAQVIRKDSHTVTVDTTNMTVSEANSDIAKKMRASYYLIGAELGRFGKANVSFPGGCDFGLRPIDQHIKGFLKLGANIHVESGNIEGEAPEGLKGSNVFFDIVSVGATVNIILAAVLAEGQTVIENAAREPHIVDLSNFLNMCGADIKGAGTDTIRIRGVESLHGCSYTIIPDMIEAGTYMTAVAAACGDVTLCNLIPKHMESVTAKLEEMGVTVIEYDDSIRIIRNTDQKLNPCNIKTMPYPGFPTDMQPQFGALLCYANGAGRINEAVWENRFKYIDELKRMGADISVSGRIATVNGKGSLTGASVRACDLRGGAAMVVAALAAEGITSIDDVHLIERGYDNIVGKLIGLGAQIKKMTVASPEPF
ncbi:MAG: UDP-N-acetylglucosamine 1-carboxyvinyltransferase [Clostridia bacterium]|nr:UDP-N-acetylglucosamine 1-carboxyvinyltransferase [Clostridia bacterium]